MQKPSKWRNTQHCRGSCQGGRLSMTELYGNRGPLDDVTEGPFWLWNGATGFWPNLTFCAKQEREKEPWSCQVLNMAWRSKQRTSLDMAYEGTYRFTSSPLPRTTTRSSSRSGPTRWALRLSWNFDWAVMTIFLCEVSLYRLMYMSYIITYLDVQSSLTI